MGYEVVTSAGEKIVLADKPFSSGGEGEVRKVLTPSHYKHNCVKIYHQNKRTKIMSDKILFMVSNPPNIIRSNGFMIGWPIARVLHLNGDFVGFMMPLAFDGSKELVYLTSTSINLKKIGSEWSIFSRENGGSALVARLKLMNNIAIPIHLLHETNKYVLKDFKPQNVLVTREGKVTIVDMDSVQIVDNGKLLFPGTVATPDYIPPEAYSLKIGSDTHKALDKSWDYFAFSVVFYQILFGLHPYVVTPKNQIDDNSNTIQSSISQNLFPFGSNKFQIAGYPELHKKFNVLPKEIQDLFIRSFSSDVSSRPGASEWGKMIHMIVKNVPAIKIDPPKPPDTPPARPVPDPIPRRIDNYSTLSWIALFVCLPLGIPALICSGMVKKNFENGNYKKARNFANAAKVLSVVAIFIVFVFISIVSSIE